jgi:hypothetical protein
MFPSSLATPIKLMGECKMSRLSNTLLTLIERAEKKGSAIKRVREGSVMGGYTWGMSAAARRDYIKSTPMINQWEVVYALNLDSIKCPTYQIYHYDTLIAEIEQFMPNGYRLNYWYGQSNTDRDALNGLVSHFGISGYGFRYLPSKDKFYNAMAEEVSQ